MKIQFNIADALLSYDPEAGYIYRAGKRVGHEDYQGYIRITLRIDGKYKQFRAHRLAWEAARGKIPLGMVVDHINNDKSDNRLVNLQLLTPKENTYKAAEQERMQGPRRVKGKLTEKTRADIMFDRFFGTQRKEIAKKYKVSVSTVDKICKDWWWMFK